MINIRIVKKHPFAYVPWILDVPLMSFSKPVHLLMTDLKCNILFEIESFQLYKKTAWIKLFKRLSFIFQDFMEVKGCQFNSL